MKNVLAWLVVYLSTPNIFALNAQDEYHGFTSANGLVRYIYADATGYGYFDVYGPELKGNDGYYYPIAVPKRDVNERDRYEKDYILKITQAFCSALDLSRNANHDSTWTSTAKGEKIIEGILGAPQTLSRNKSHLKITAVNCENIYDPNRSTNSGGGVELVVIGGRICLPVNGACP